MMPMPTEKCTTKQFVTVKNVLGLKWEEMKAEDVDTDQNRTTNMKSDLIWEFIPYILLYLYFNHLQAIA